MGQISQISKFFNLTPSHPFHFSSEYVEGIYFSMSMEYSGKPRNKQIKLQPPFHPQLFFYFCSFPLTVSLTPLTNCILAQNKYTVDHSPTT